MMPEPQPAEIGELAHLHAVTCLSMTRFINGQQCPTLAHRIVSQLNRLLAHPDLEPASNTREMYRQLLEHWQKIAAELLEQRRARTAAVVYH